MRNFRLYSLAGIILGLFFSMLNSAYAQNQKAKLTKENFYFDADNMAYYLEGARLGIIPFNQSVPVKPAEFKGTLIKTSKFVDDSPDIAISTATSTTQSENSVFVDPNDNQHVLNSNNSTDWDGSFVDNLYGADYFRTYNGSSSWTGSIAGAGGSNSGDPAAAISNAGRRFIGYITDDRGQGASYSDNGTSWTAVDITGTYYYPDLMDKNHLMVDNSGGIYDGNVYSAWTHLEYSNPPPSNHRMVEFARSTDNGVSFPIIHDNISAGVSAGYMCQGANIQIGPTGQVYVCFCIYDDNNLKGPSNESAMGFTRSLNGGTTFSTAVRAIDNILGIRDSGITKDMRVNSFPSMAVDVSGGAFNGNIYIVWANRGTPGINTGTNVSVYMIRSEDGGTTWSSAIKVNQGPFTNGKEAYIPWITCDPSTGNLFCIFYDDRNTVSSDVETFVAYSTDGGDNWEDFVVSDVSFTPDGIPGLAVNYFGDYLGITALDNYVYPCWTDNRSGRALTYVSPFYFGEYCFAIATNLNYEYISNVNIGSINNTSGSDGYADYTAFSTDVPVNGSESIIVTNGSPSSPSQCRIWVDWNRDGDFDDTGETFIPTGTPGPGPYTASISPTAGTTTGDCVMRVRITYNSTPLPCGSVTYGEVEDYTINVTPEAPNVWTGATNNYWHNNGNWSLGHIPTAGEDVIMTTAGYHPPAIDFYDEECHNLTIQAGAGLEIADQSLTVNDIYIYGDLELSNTASRLYVNHDIKWHSGATGSMSGSATIDVKEDWNFESGANVQFTAGYVDFSGTATTWIRSYETNCQFYRIRSDKEGGASLNVSNLSTADLNIAANIYNYAGSVFRSVSPHTIHLGGFFNNLGGNFYMDDGTFEFNGNPSAVGLKPNTGDYFNNLIINSSSALSLDNTYTSSLIVIGEVTIESGSLNANDFTIEVGNTWTNNVGPAGFNEGTSRVLFNQTAAGVQFIVGDQHFNIIEVNTTNGIRPNGSISCNIYDWTMGGVSTSGHTFTAYDLADNSLYGFFYALTNGTIILNEQTSFVDLFGDLYAVNNGHIQITGGADDSYWASGTGTTNTITIETGGIIEFVDWGINIFTSGTLNTNITDGTLKCGGDFICYRTDFNPNGGVVEMSGGSDAYVSMAAGSTFHDFAVNKTGGDKSSFLVKDRDGTTSNSSKSNTAILSSDIVIENDVFITDGIFNSNVYDIYLGADWSNAIGPAAFTEGTNTVFFNGPNEGDILTSEFFYNMTVDKSNNLFTALEMFDNVTVTNDIHIVDGVLEMNSPSNLMVGNNVTIESDAGLNANDGTDLIIYVGGNWTNYNTDYDIYHGFWHGYVCTVIFNTGGDNILTTSAPQEDFYNLTIYKPSDEFRTNDNIQVFGKLLLFDGEWNDNVSGLTHTFHGDFEVTNNAAWFTHVSPNTVVFTGLNDQEFIYNHIGVGYFKDVIVNKVPADNVISSDLDPSGTAAAGKNDGAKAQMLTMLTDMDIQLGGTLTINEGTMEINGNTLRGDGNITINGGALTLNSNSTLWLDDGAELSVNGGLLETIGTPGNLAHITHRNTGYYAFEIEGGGTISAEYTLFEYTNSNGVWIKGDGFADLVHTFHYCTFQNGTAGFAPLLVINNGQVLTLNGVNFPQTGVSDYNAAKAFDGGEMNMVGATGAFEGENYEYDPYNRIHWTYPSRFIDITMYIEGPFQSSTNKMNLGLNSILPLDQPFDTPPLSNPSPDWYYTGTESVGTIPNPFIVDWVLVQLRDAPNVTSATPETAIFTQAAFITNTGQIVGLDGSSPLTFSGTNTNNLYAVVWTRNHLGLISANALVDVGGTFTYDFSSAAGQALGGTAAQHQLSTSPVIWGAIPGDSNASGLVAIGDKTNVWWLLVGDFGYLESDFNFDGQTDNVDKNDFWFPNMGSSSFIPE